MTVAKIRKAYLIGNIAPFILNVANTPSPVTMDVMANWNTVGIYSFISAPTQMSPSWLPSSNVYPLSGSDSGIANKVLQK